MPKEVLLDARWLGRGGVGTVTDLTLRSLRAKLAKGASLPSFTALGRPALLEPYRRDGLDIRPDGRDPHRFLGQAAWTPRRSVVEVAFHQYRPLSRRRRLQWVHDLIPVHVAPTRWARRAKAAYIRRIVETSDFVLTASEHTRRGIAEELGGDAGRIEVIRYPVDLSLREQVLRRRSELPRSSDVLFVGRFAPHKNLPRLIAAFEQSELRRQGGRLRLVGGTDAEVAQIRALAAPLRRDVVVDGVVPRERIVDLLATSAALVLPSTEEGFGLPVWEARAVDLPFVAAGIGSIPELVDDPSVLFDPYDVGDITRALDELVVDDGLIRNPLPAGPDLDGFGDVFLRALEQV